MVGDYPHSYIGFGILTVCFTGHRRQTLDRRLEYIRIVVALLTLQHHTETLKAHSGIDMLCGQRFELAVSLAVELHEHQVPDFDHQVVSGIDQFTSVEFRPFGVVTQIEMNFAARAAGTGVPHLPEIIMFVAQQDMILGQKLLPVGISLIVPVDPLLRTTFEYRGINAVLGQAVHLNQKFPGP